MDKCQKPSNHDLPRSKSCSSFSPSSSLRTKLEAKSQPSRSKSVRFSSIQCFEFPVTVGMNPACKVGPALELADWTPCRIWEPVALEVYEDIVKCDKNSFSNGKRQDDDLVLSVQERENILLQNGLSSREIWRVAKDKDNYRKKLCGGPHIQDNQVVKSLLSPLRHMRERKAHLKRLEILRIIQNKNVWDTEYEVIPGFHSVDAHKNG